MYTNVADLSKERTLFNYMLTRKHRR